MRHSKTTPRKRRKVTAFRVIMAVLLAAGCAFAVYRLCLRSQLNARIEAIRAAGYPVTLEELDKWYSIPDDAENAAYTMEEAFSFYAEWDEDKAEPLPLFGKAQLPPRTEPLAEDTSSRVAEYLADNQEALELLHAGAEIEHCRYPLDMGAGFETLLPHLSDIRKGAMLLELEAILHAEKDEPQLAIRSVTAALGVARSLAKEPIPVSQFLRAACQRLAVSGVERVVNRVELTDEQLARLSQDLIEAEDLSTMARALAGERCFQLSIVKMSPTEMSHALGRMYGGNSRPPVAVHRRTLSLAFHKAAGLTDRSTIAYLDLMEDYVEATGLDLESRREAVDAISERAQVISATPSLLRELFSGLWGADRINLRGFAKLRAAWVALAVQRYRLAAGELPDSLAELVPDYLDSVPVDPFDGRQLRYRMLESGYVVYSIGMDLTDDGGKERQSRSKTKGSSSNWDITFIVER